MTAHQSLDLLLRQIPRQRPDFFLEIVDNEAFLYHLSDNRILYCNQTAALVWRLCDGQRSGEEIARLLREAFPEAGWAVDQDVAQAMAEFVRQQAMDFLPASHPPD